MAFFIMVVIGENVFAMIHNPSILKKPPPVARFLEKKKIYFIIL